MVPDSDPTRSPPQDQGRVVVVVDVDVVPTMSVQDMFS